MKTIVKFCTGFALLLLNFGANAQTAYLEIASNADIATAANSGSSSGQQSVSDDGRFVVFGSTASNLVDVDVNGPEGDIFVRDRQTKTTTLVSKSSQGTQGQYYSRFPAISGDGRYIAFVSRSDNLVDGDTNNIGGVSGIYDAFVHDLQTSTTTRINVSSAGDQANAGVEFNKPLSLSHDGCCISFASEAGNLVPNDTNSAVDVFVHDRGTGLTTRVSVDSAGVQGNGFSGYPSISGDGRLVVFQSVASNLVANDINGVADIFVHDRQTGETKRINLDIQGNETNNIVQNCTTLSTDGRYVGFASYADNMVPGDNNGSSDAFLYDLQTQTMRRVGINTNCPSISGDNRFVTVQYSGPNGGQVAQLLLLDLRTGVATNLHRDKFGVFGSNMVNFGFSMSGTGKFITFTSDTSGWTLDAGTKGAQSDVFVAIPDYIFAYGMEVVPQ